MAKPHPEKKSQSVRFINTARELDCDEDEDRFNATLKKIVKGGAAKDKEQPPKD